MTTEHDKKVDQLVEMGFDRKKADLALSRSHDDLEVAMNFLVGPDDNDEIFSLREEGNLIRATEAPLAAETVGIPIIPSNYASNTYANPSVPTGQAFQPYSASTFAVPPPISTSNVPVAQPVSWGSEGAGNEKPSTGNSGSMEDQQLQEALALSLKEETRRQAPGSSSTRIHGVSKEDEEMARAIEQSLQAEGGGIDCGTDPNGDPHKLLKEPGNAVGLKNVGNTCYCNSLLQTYWAIGVFRQAVMECTLPHAVGYRGGAGGEGAGGVAIARTEWGIGAKSNENQEEARKQRENLAAMELVGELQRLFIYMALSNRKMVDPSPVLGALLDSKGKPVKVGNQEDVSEFNHIFLLRVQQGLNAAYSAQSGSNESDLNPITRNFEGKMLQEVAAFSHDGQRQVLSSSSVEFLEVILDIAKQDVHAALEDYMEAHLEDYQGSAGRRGTAQKSVWLQKLPPILTLQLQRVHYDKKLQAAVKVHTPFRFPATLYMDRYLEEHRDQVSDKRQHVAQLRKEIEQLQASLSALNKFTHPASNLSAEQAVAKDEYIAGVLALLKDEAGAREAQHAACVEMLERRLQAVQKERAELEKALKQRVGECDEVYAHLQKHPYSLLAVLVHDGLAGSGHYWAYIKGGVGGKDKSGCWHKYSDMNVTQVEESEVWSVSQGGGEDTARGSDTSDTSRASAYCLFYHRTDMAQHIDAGAAGCMPYVPPHLREEVEEDNRKLEEEITAWERKHTVHGLCAQLEEQCTALVRAHNDAGRMHTNFSLEYFLLRLKEPSLSRFVVASALASSAMGSKSDPDNQIMTQLNQASSAAFELDAISEQRLKEHERSHWIWIMVQRHYLAAKQAPSREEEMLSLAAASKLKDMHDSQLGAAAALFPPAGMDLRSIVTDMQNELAVLKEQSSSQLLQVCHRLNQVCPPLLSAVQVLDPQTIKNVSQQTYHVVAHVHGALKASAPSSPNRSMQDASNVTGSQRILQRLEQEALAVMQGSHMQVPSFTRPTPLPSFPAVESREDAALLAQRLLRSQCSNNPQVDDCEELMRLSDGPGVPSAPKCDDPMDLQ